MTTTENNIAKSSLDEWIYFLKNEEIKDKFGAKGLDRAKEALDVMKLGDKDRAVYKRREENKIYKESLLYTAEKKGEKRAKIEIAKSLLRAEVNIDIIVMSTGLTIEEIKALK
jgi:predicted transposase/invertase (TIGR01784 family)